MARRRLQPTVGIRIILRSIGKTVRASAAVSIVIFALSVIGLIVVLAKSFRMTKRPRQTARGIISRFSCNKASPDQ